MLICINYSRIPHLYIYLVEIPILCCIMIHRHKFIIRFERCYTTMMFGNLTFAAFYALRRWRMAGTGARFWQTDAFTSCRFSRNFRYAYLCYCINPTKCKIIDVLNTMFWTFMLVVAFVIPSKLAVNAFATRWMRAEWRASVCAPCSHLTW